MFLNLPEWAKIALGVLVIAGFLLSRAAVRYPHVQWLRAFDVRGPVDPARQARLARAGKVKAGVEMILLGVVLPIGYAALTLMTWSDFKTGLTVAVFGTSAVLITAGTVVLIRAVGNRG